jgi:uncharacterized membrane protein YoaK (UPF0700 family)
MVDLTGFLTLGNIFTAHITGNLVVLAAVLVRGGQVNLAQALAIPMFMVAVAISWLLATASGRRGAALARLLLFAQFLLLAGVLIVSVIANPSARPHGLMAGIAVMIAVCAMACQYALFRIALPDVVSTAVMTGNLTNTVLSLMNAVSSTKLLAENSAQKWRKSVPLLVGFFIGCVVATVAVSLFGEWAWSLPLALAGVAMVLR